MVKQRKCKAKVLELIQLTDEAVAGVLAVYARALVEVFDGNAERALRTRATDARVITVVNVACSNRFADQINDSTVYPYLCSVSKHYFTTSLLYAPFPNAVQSIVMNRPIVLVSYLV